MFMRLFQAGKSSDFGVIRGAGPGGGKAYSGKQENDVE